MLPREIQVDNGPDRTVYDFPVRPLGKFHSLGLVPMGFSVLFLWMPAHEWFHCLIRILKENKHGGFEWFFVAFLSLFMLAGLVPFAIGVFMLAGRTRLVLTRERIISTEVAGPLRWSRKARLTDIEDIGILGQRTSAATHNRPPAFANWGAMGASRRRGKPIMLLVGYPRDWLQAVAADLSAQMRLQGVTVKVTQPQDEDESNSTKGAAEKVPDKPTESPVQLENRADGLRLEVPAAGLRRGSKGLAPFAVCWTVMVLLMTATLLFSAKSRAPQWQILGILSLLWVVSAALWAIAIDMGRRHVSLRVEGSRLSVDQTGLFGLKHWEWQRSEITGIQVAPSGMEVNNVPVLELQVHGTARKKVGLLRFRSEAELRWMASVLRKALDVGVQPALK